MLLAGSFFGLPITGNSQDWVNPYIQLNTLVREEHSVWPMCPEGSGNNYQQVYTSIAMDGLPDFPGYSISVYFDQQSDCPELFCLGSGTMLWKGFGVPGEGNTTSTCYGDWSGEVDPFSGIDMPPWRNGPWVRQDPNGPTYVYDSVSLALVTGRSWQIGGWGPSAPNKINLHRLCYSVQDGRSMAYAPYGDIMALGKQANADSCVYKALPDDTTVDATPSVSAQFSDSIYYSVWNDAASVELQDATFGYVTDRTNVVYVGEHLLLRCHLSWDIGLITNYAWSVEGTAIAAWQMAADQSWAKVVWTNLSADAQVGFFWLTEGTNVVECTVQVEGETMTAKGTFIVRKPQAWLRVWPKWEVEVTTNCAPVGPFYKGYYHLTTGKNFTYDDVGVRYDYGITDLAGFEGSFEMAIGQILLAPSSGDDNLDLGEIYKSWSYVTNGLDGVWPYDVFQGQLLTNDIPVIDTPAHPLEHYERYVRRYDKFWTILTWRSLRTDSTPIPLKIAKWSWAGEAKKVQGPPPPVWYLYSRDNPELTYGLDVTGLPEWTSKVAPPLTVTTNDFYHPEPQ